MIQKLLPEIGVFVLSVDLGSFAAAAGATGQTPSAVARIVTRLEETLGARLLHRSTRRLVLTPEGVFFLEQARRLLTLAAEAAEGVAVTSGAPRGTLRVNSGTAFARHRLAPHLPEFLAACPDVRLDLTISDHLSDPLAEQADVTVRVGPLADSDLLAVPLGVVRRVIAASPAYLARHGTPQVPADLARHQCLLLSRSGRLARWPMFVAGERELLPVSGSVTADSADLLLDLALAGAGILRFGDFLGAAAVQDGRLVPLLTRHHDDDPQPLTALVPPGRSRLPAVRAFLDFLKELPASDVLP